MNGEMESSILGKLQRVKGGGDQLQHTVATLSRAESDNSEGFSFWKCEGFSASDRGARNDSSTGR